MSTFLCTASTSTDADVVEDSALFAASQAFRMRCKARLSPGSVWPSLGCFRLNCVTQYSINLWSKSSPPRCVSPAVALTSKTPESIVSRVTSNVPPPKSNTRTCSSLSAAAFSRPYAIAAAVGSLMTRATFKPAIVPASFVACRCASLKYAGTVTTACSTFSPRKASAVSFIFVSTIAEISSGVICFRLCSLMRSSILGVPSLAETTRKGQCFMSA
mmetsp:Transcript_19909/g.61612  ORF Transcript_19909/g.61612 Transcript_19909/m.61612 type:complete len:216 (-) Transcript_19909:229-876(-)